MGEPDIDLAFLARQQSRTLDEMASIRDDMRVLTAIVTRQDGTMTAVLQEVRALHSQIGRINDRLRRLEDAEGPAP